MEFERKLLSSLVGQRIEAITEDAERPGYVVIIGNDSTPIAKVKVEELFDDEGNWFEDDIQA